MGMHPLFNSGPGAIFLDDLLDPPSGIGTAPAALKQVTVLRIRAHLARQNQAETCREENISVLRAFALFDEDFAPAEVHVFYLDVHQLAHADRREEEKLEHYLVLDLSAFLDRSKESL